MNINNIIKTSVKYCSLFLLLGEVDALEVKVVDKGRNISLIVQVDDDASLGSIRPILLARGFDCSEEPFTRRRPNGKMVKLDDNKPLLDQIRNFDGSLVEIYTTVHRVMFYLRFPIPVGSNPLNPYLEQRWFDLDEDGEDCDDDVSCFLDRRCSEFRNARCDGFYAQDPTEHSDAKKLGDENENFTPGMTIFPWNWEVKLYMTFPEGVPHGAPESEEEEGAEAQDERTVGFFIPMNCRNVGEAIRYIQGDNDERCCALRKQHKFDPNNTPRKEFITNPDLDILNYKLSYNGEPLQLTDGIPQCPNPQTPIILGGKKEIEIKILMHYSSMTGYARQVYVDPNEPLSVLSLRVLHEEYANISYGGSVPRFFNLKRDIDSKIILGRLNPCFYTWSDFNESGVVFVNGQCVDPSSTFAQLSESQPSVFEKCFHVMASPKINLCFLPTNMGKCIYEGNRLKKLVLSYDITPETCFTPLDSILQGAIPPEVSVNDQWYTFLDDKRNHRVYLVNFFKGKDNRTPEAIKMQELIAIRGAIAMASVTGESSEKAIARAKESNSPIMLKDGIWSLSDNLHLEAVMPGGPGKIQNTKITLIQWFDWMPEGCAYVFGWVNTDKKK